MANGIAFFIILALAFSYFALSSSMNVPFEGNGRGEIVRDPEEEEITMESESARRVLAGRGYISYGALQKNIVPCNQRGHSYYSCNSRRQANPYRRGCNIITRCGGR
ncbi:putative rapid ALkalinization Factor [Helianthus debilis subsp. tardiflorus]